MLDLVIANVMSDHRGDDLVDCTPFESVLICSRDFLFSQLPEKLVTQINPCRVVDWIINALDDFEYVRELGVPMRILINNPVEPSYMVIFSKGDSVELVFQQVFRRDLFVHLPKMKL